MRQFADAGVGNGLRQRELDAFFPVRHQDTLVVKKIDGHFRHHNFHDAFAVAGARDAAGFGVGITAAADERRIAHASRKFTASAASGGARCKISMAIDCDGADGTLLVANVVFGGVRIFETPAPGGTFALVHKIFGRAERHIVFQGEFFRAGADKHHVFTFFEDAARKTDWISHALHGGDGAGFQGRAVHYNSVELNVAITIQMRAETRVKRGIVLEDYDSGFDCIHRRAGAGQDLPAGFKSAADSRAAALDCFIGNIPCATVNDQRRFQV